MKKINLLLALPILASVVSCSSGNNNQEEIKKQESQTQSIDKTQVIFNLLNNVNVTAKGKETISYDDPKFTFLNTTRFIEIDRDYSSIVEENGKITPAIRENTNQIFDTFFKGDDGAAVSEYLTPENTVQKDDLQINGASILYNEIFSNPFLYIDENDIGDDLSLDPVKANFIVESYTGSQRAVKSAKLNVENNKATSIDIDFYERKDGIPDGYGFVYYTSTFDLDISFDYNVTPIKHLTPRSEADETITKALENDENYTMVLNSDIISKDAIYYVTKDSIYLHFGSRSVGPEDKDIFYKKANNGTYESYVYKKSVNKFNLELVDVKREDILPDISKINENVLLKESENVYNIDKIAAKYGLNNFIPSYFMVEEGLGINGSIILKDGKLSSFRGTFNVNNPFNVRQSYYDYNETTLPSWLDLSIIM